MRKVMFVSALSVLAALAGSVTYASDCQQEDATIGLNCLQLIELVGVDMDETITPGPEDYARDLDVEQVVNDEQVIATGIAQVAAGAAAFTAVTDAATAAAPAGVAAVVTAVVAAAAAAGADAATVAADAAAAAAAPPPGVTPIDAATAVAANAAYAAAAAAVPPIISNNTGGEAAHDNAMYDANNDIGKGFAERTDALAMTIFTNAQDGAALYVHGQQPAQQQGILRLEDTYVSVCTEKTYILQNALEGASTDACSAASMEETSTDPSDTHRVEDNPRNNMNSGFDATTPTMGYDGEAHGGDPTSDAYSLWLRIHNQAQYLFEVKMATKAPRLIVINLGIANLARYTEGQYTNTLTFTLMPIVG